jgi:hypothetical protein
MLEALKIKNPVAKPGMIEMAKTIPRDQKPAVRYRLMTEVKEFGAEVGHLILIAEINWDFPTYQDASKSAAKKVEFKYNELAQFRKELALKLEEVCDFFN